MGKVRFFSNGSYKYFKHCPFCGSVAVDYEDKTFSCPDCGAVVTFRLPKREAICDGPSDSERMVYCWNKRPVEEITADDLCVMAQKTEREDEYIFFKEIQDETWTYVVKSAKIGKYECELPKKFTDPDFYRKKKFDVVEKGNSFIISWKKDIKWDYE